MKKYLLLSLLTTSLLLTDTTASACTTLLVGKEQTTDGSYIAARTVDGHAQNMTRLALHPRLEKQRGNYISTQDKFTYPLPMTGMAYSSTPDTDDIDSWGESGFNEAGVGMSSTETICHNEQALALDPYIPDTGTSEATMFENILPAVTSAKAGAARLGQIIEEKGASEGFGAAFIDRTGIWYLESAGGHRWMAARIPDNMYFATGNQGRLRTYDPADTANYMGSKDLIGFARQHGLCPKDGPFDFHKAYILDEAKDHTYSYPRVWAIQHTLTPSITTTVENGAEHPVFLSADKKISLADIKAVFRNHYTCTSHDPYLHKNPKEPYRPIDIFRCEQSHILQIRPELPAAIGSTMYIAFGMPSLGLYLPIYQGANSYIPAYWEGSYTSAIWKYRRLQTLAMTDYNTYAPAIQKAYAGFEAATAIKQDAMEKKYLALYKTQPKEAKKLLQAFEDDVMQGGIDLADKLFNELLTKMMQSVETKYMFHRA